MPGASSPGFSAGARILITGASGFVGVHAIRELERSMPEATLLRIDSNRHPSNHDDGQSLALDITRRADVYAAIADLRPTVVLHLAAIAAPPEAEADPVRAWEVNVFGTMHLAGAILKHVPEAHLLFVGSSEAYGASFNLVDGPLSEEAQLRPLTSYATTKAAAELVVGQFVHSGLRAVTFRPFNHTGPGQSPSYVVPAFARQVARVERGLQEPVIEVGAIDAERDFLDVRDVARAYAEAAMNLEALEPGTVLNLASGQPWRIRAILERLIALGGVKVDIRVDPARVRQNKVPRTWGNNGLARAALGWSPSIPFDQTLLDVLNDWRIREG
ncbi:MAG TPA: NAD-dependent epimerase/dehydratase family protein [Bauldia sp.]|nr:NAD-dependent epimerase/dehydratase family protein [Bauldia sp.]